MRENPGNPGACPQSPVFPTDCAGWGGVADLVSQVRRVHRILRNRDLQEDRVLSEIRSQCLALRNLRKNVQRIFDYAFTEMLNNAIEHSLSKSIDVSVECTDQEVRADIRDQGLGLFENIMQKKRLANHVEALQDLLKGKQTTAPEAHSGDGIFFTSRAVDILRLRSSDKQLLFDNLGSDVFVSEIRPRAGTRVMFSCRLDSKRDLSKVFGAYTGDTLEFSKTEVAVRLYRQGLELPSRSQARRILSGLERFKSVTLDFNGITCLGQAFADEIFRVFSNAHPEIRFQVLNAAPAVQAMIGHVAPGKI